MYAVVGTDHTILFQGCIKKAERIRCLAPLPEDSADTDTPEQHVEVAGFKGDRVLANSQLFMIEFGWWTEIAYAISEGDIGRAYEILKVNHVMTICPTTI